MAKLYPAFFTFSAPLSRWLSSLGILLLATGAAQAATVKWDGGAGTALWTDAANWAPDGVPTSADDVIFDNTHVAGSYTVTLSGLSRTARSVQVGYSGNTNTITLRITGGGAGDNLRIGGAPGYDLIVADGGTLHNLSTVSGAGNRGIEFLNPATDSWQLTGNGTYLHEQANGDFLNVTGANASFAPTTTFEVRNGLTTTWGGATGGLSYIKSYGGLRLNPTLAAATTFNVRVATDSLLVTGDLTVFNSLLTLQLTDNGTLVRAHVLGNVAVTNAKLYVSSGSAKSVLKVDGNVTTAGAAARIGATASSGDKGVLAVGGNLAAYYTAGANNELLTFWKPGSVTVSTWAPVSGSTFKDVVIRKEVRLNGVPSITGASQELAVLSDGTLDFNGFNVTGTGRFSVQSGGTLKVTSEDGIMASAAVGNVRVSGMRSYSTGANYWYTSLGFQATGDGLPTTVNSLRLVKGDPQDEVTLVNPVTVTSNLTLNTGLLVIGNNNVTMSVGSTLTGGSANSYVRTDGSPTATGTLVRQIPNTGVDVVFPVGTISYTPATLSQNVSGTTDNFNVRVFDGVYSNGTSGTVITSRVVDRTWMIAEAVVGGSNAALTLQWNTADEGENFTRTFTRIRHYVGGMYDEAMSEVPAQGTDPYKITRSGIGSFSPFIVGSTPVLPVELIRFNARLAASAVQLTWATASERNCDFFEIQRSVNGKDFTTIGDKVEGHGTTMVVQEYAFADYQLPVAAMAYYRLRQVDRDGSQHYSNVQAVRLSKAVLSELLLFPNPATDQISVGLPTTGGVVLVHDAMGREVLRQVVAATESGALLEIHALRAGAYSMVFRGTDGVQLTKPFLKQ